MIDWDDFYLCPNPHCRAPTGEPCRKADGTKVTRHRVRVFRFVTMPDGALVLPSQAKSDLRSKNSC